MCGSLLEQVPTEAPAPAQNPMWAFLKGIEGFDDARAAECLGRLLDVHYDTIAVLKLATKQDLVEDAGLKAEDALRIVSAANGTVARPESASTGAHALPWASQSCEPGCEFHEPRRKRAKTAAQEVAQQAGPREELFVPKHACGSNGTSMLPPGGLDNQDQQVDDYEGEDVYRQGIEAQNPGYYDPLQFESEAVVTKTQFSQPQVHLHS